MKYDFSAFEDIKGTGKFVEFDGMIVGEMLTGYMLVGTSRVSLGEIFEVFPVWTLNRVKNVVKVMAGDEIVDKATRWGGFNFIINGTLSFNGRYRGDKLIEGNFIYKYKSVYMEIPFEEFFSCLNRDGLYALAYKIEDVRLSRYTKILESKRELIK